MGINQNLAQILAAQYGNDVRQAIHDGIEECYTAASFNSRGVYNPNAVPPYSMSDVVYDNGGSYRYVHPTPSNTPTSSASHWQQIASVGGQALVDAAEEAMDAAQGYKDAAAGYAAQLQAGIASPVDTYENLAALNTVDPDHSKIYITLDDGKWCYHNGFAFVAGGVYQNVSYHELISETALKADAMASGSPKGQYATLVALEAAFPTGDTGAYLVQADSHLYFWDGSDWVDGGEYNVAHASKISITDTGGYFTGEDVETALVEVGQRLNNMVYVTDFASLVIDPDDWSPAINAAISAANTGNNIRVVFPAGTLGIKAPILCIGAGWYGKLQGQGYRATVIKANAEMGAMLYLSASDVLSNEKFVEHLGFNCNALALCGIDATYSAYTTIQNCRISYLPADGVAIKIGRWCNRVLNNLIFAEAVGSPQGIGIEIPNETVNNLVIQNNVMSRLEKGIVCRALPNDLHIIGNTFDLITGAAIVMVSGGRSVVISNNYFEACGKTTTTTVTTASGVTEEWYGAIVLYTYYNVVANPLNSFNNLVIEKNEFANVCTDAIIAASSLVSAEIRMNHIHPSYTGYTHFLNLLWYGAYYASAKKILVDFNQGVDGQFAVPVGLNGMDTKNHSSGLIIKNQKGRYDGLRGFCLNKPENWAGTGSGTWTVSDGGTYCGVFPIRTVAATSNSKFIIFDLTDANNSYLLGAYLRITYYSWNASTANSLRLYAYLNGSGTAFLDISENRDAPRNTGRNAVIYIPTDATELKFMAALASTGQNVSYTKFCICDAAIDLDEMRFEMEDL